MSKDTITFPSEIIELRDQIIDNGLISVEAHENRDYRREGCIKGLNLCREFNTLADYEAVLTLRHAEERALMLAQTAKEDYWRYRCATAQIEFVYERMKVACNSGGMGQYHSAQATNHVARLLGPDHG